jgi:hypothetical protein
MAEQGGIKKGTVVSGKAEHKSIESQYSKVLFLRPSNNLMHMLNDSGNTFDLQKAFVNSQNFFNLLIAIVFFRPSPYS